MITSVSYKQFFKHIKIRGYQRKAKNASEVLHTITFLRKVHKSSKYFSQNVKVEANEISSPEYFSSHKINYYKNQLHMYAHNYNKFSSAPHFSGSLFISVSLLFSIMGMNTQMAAPHNKIIPRVENIGTYEFNSCSKRPHIGGPNN